MPNFSQETIEFGKAMLVIGAIVGGVVACCVTMWMDEGAGFRKSKTLFAIFALFCLSCLSGCQVVKGFRQFNSGWVQTSHTKAAKETKEVR